MEEPRGFGGWLIVALIECVITAAVSAFNLLTTLSGLSSSGLPGGGTLAMEGVSIVLNLAAAALVATEQRFFPQVFAAALVWRVVKNAVDILAPREDLKVLATDMTALLTAIAVALAWAFYLRNSVRVRNTFPSLRPE
jgi:hypothetical protein